MIFGRKKTVYYPGTTLSKFFPDLVMNWKSILSDFGVVYEVMDDLNPGWALWDQGYHEQFEEHREALKQKLRSRKVLRVISSSPEAVYMLREHYGIDAVHTTEIVFQYLQKVQAYNTGEVCFHDNTTQVRRNGIVREPREILVRAGFDLKEFLENKEDTQCLGTSTGLVNNSPRLAAKLAMHRVRKSPSKTIITDSPEDYLHLRRSTSANVLELSEVLVEI